MAISPKPETIIAIMKAIATPLEAQLAKAQEQLHSVLAESHPNREENANVWRQTIEYISTMIMARDTGIS